MRHGCHGSAEEGQGSVNAEAGAPGGRRMTASNRMDLLKTFRQGQALRIALAQEGCQRLLCRADAHCTFRLVQRSGSIMPG